MEKITKKTAIALIAGLVLGAAPAAFAQNVYIDAGSDTSVGVDGAVDVNVGAQTQTNVGATTSGTGGQSTAGSASAGAIVVTRGSASEDDATVSTASAVATVSDLAAYAATVVRSDENAERAELSSDNVSLRYKQRAYLLGIIPIFATVTTTVESNGTVTVSYPW